MLETQNPGPGGKLKSQPEALSLKLSGTVGMQRHEPLSYILLKPLWTGF